MQANRANKLRQPIATFKEKFSSVVGEDSRRVRTEALGGLGLAHLNPDTSVTGYFKGDSEAIDLIRSSDWAGGRMVATAPYDYFQDRKTGLDLACAALIAEGNEINTGYNGTLKERPLRIFVLGMAAVRTEQPITEQEASLGAVWAMIQEEADGLLSTYRAEYRASGAVVYVPATTEESLGFVLAELPRITGALCVPGSTTGNSR